MCECIVPYPAWLQGRAESIHTAEDAVAFVNAVGFCTVDRPVRWEFPYLAAAFPGSPDSVLGRVWFWKDDLHVDRHLYYTRLFGGKPGFLSNTWLPLFIAAYGEVADELIYSGRLSQTARAIYEMLEQGGPLPAREVREALGPETRRHSETALKELERRFIITKVGLTGRHRGTYGYVLDLAERWVPEAFTAAGSLRREVAVERIHARLRVWDIHPDARFLRLAGLAPAPSHHGK